jgi:hypothetical protein
MKTTVSGNGVKVANRFEIARKIEGKGYWTDYRISKMKSADLLAYWDYKAEGLTLDVARAQLLNAIATRKQIASTKKTPALKRSSGRFLALQIEKRKSIELYLKSVEKMDPAQRAYSYSYGTFRASIRTFVLKGLSTPYPVTMKITWSEDHDWNFYAKSYGKPKSTYTDRAIEFQTIGKLGKVETIYRHELTTFAGNFVEKAIAAFLKVGKVKVSKELKSIQLADFFSVVEKKAINGYRLFERRIGELVWDFAIIDTKTGANYHHSCYDELVAGSRRKIEAKIEREIEVITKETGYSLGFCEPGMRAFCDDNNVDFDGEYTRQELRNIVIANRSTNCKKYRNELNQIGIVLNCK